MRIRLLLVRPWVVLAALVTCVVLRYWTSFAAWVYGLRPADLTVRDIPEGRMGTIALAGCAAVYAGWRALAHPGSNRPYRRWLATTPWRVGLPLPLGPATLVWQDGLMLAIICGLAVAEGLSPLYPLLTGSVVYLLLMTSAVLLSGQSWFLVVAALLVPAAGFCSGWATLIVPGVLIVLLRIADERGLRRFPWEEETGSGKEKRIMLQPWPFGMVNGYEPKAGLTWPQSLGVAALVAWWIFGWLHSAMDTGMPQAITVLILGAEACAAIRLVGYIGPYGSPLSPLARIATGRLVIRDYDKALVAPAVAATVGFALPASLASAGLRPSLVVAIGTFAVLALVLGMGPSMRDWALTGQHYLRATRMRRRA